MTAPLRSSRRHGDSGRSVTGHGAADAGSRPPADSRDDHRPHRLASGRHRRLILTGSITGAVIVALDGTVLTIAQPALQRDLHASFVQVQWTSTGYLIAVAGLLVLAGRLGDRYGHQRIFALGILGFGAASAGIGLAPGIGWVIALRIAQGVFGALLQPATLGMLRATYPPDRLAMPLALRTSAIGLSAAVGPVLGGALSAQFGWRAVFFLNVPPALIVGALALAARVPTPPHPDDASGTAAPPPTPTSPRPARSPLDLPGAALLSLALLCLVHTLVALPQSGWTVATLLTTGFGTAACGAFVRHERRTASPLVPPAVLTSRAVVSALSVLLCASAGMFGALFVGSYFLQDVLGLDPLQSGLRVLPLAVMMVLSAPASAVLQRRHGPRRTTLAAMSLLTAGILLLSQLTPGSPVLVIGGGFALLGAGFGTVMVTATAVIVRHVPVAHAGVAGGLQQTAMNIGPTLGVALATMLTTLTSAMSTTLLALSAVAATGALAAWSLPLRNATKEPEEESEKETEGEPEEEPEGEAEKAPASPTRPG
ncbi:MFS transporter [Streptomyces nigrescens]|uniref:MFS transporter n=1 Tax=Streptomyces nigrescens TaxID=1920 RepID=A0ABM7ZZ14_STRNI|nr:MFS transporter [Streptomyces nigrescens]BDM71517.1 MFS transporter [Streptomyces nigrescens]